MLGEDQRTTRWWLGMPGIAERHLKANQRSTESVLVCNFYDLLALLGYTQ